MIESNPVPALHQALVSPVDRVEKKYTNTWSRPDLNDCNKDLKKLVAKHFVCVE